MDLPCTTRKPRLSQPKNLDSDDIRTLVIASLGSALEFYDFVVFVFLANVIAHLFFPPTIPEWVRQTQTFAIFAAGYLARPLGGLWMGQISDLRGRKAVFTFTVLLMAVSTLLIACLPTYRTIGVAAPLLLLLMRIAQGAAIGGEAPAAWVFVAEKVPKGRQGLAIGLLTGGLSLGILLGSLIAICLSTFFKPAQVLDGAWRIVFILGGLFGLLTVRLRRQISESPAFKKMRQLAESHHTRIKTVLKHHKGSVALSMILTWTLTAIIIVVILMAPSLLQVNSGIPLGVLKIANATGTLALCFSVIALGALSDRFGSRYIIGPMLLVSAAGDYLLYSADYRTAPVAICLFYILAGLGAGAIVLAPIKMVRLFPMSVRVTGVSFSYNTAYAVLGGITPPLIGWLSHFDHLAPAHYTTLSSCAALLVLLARSNEPEGGGCESSMTVSPT